ncbi:unnamed protein product [Merluccius merluccius]
MAAPTEHVENSDLAECTQTTENTADDTTDNTDGEDEARVRETPEDLRLEAICNTLAFHPGRDLLACGDLDGDIYLYAYSCTEGENKELWSSGHHLKSCREVAFSGDGEKLFSVSKDRCVHVIDVEAGRLATRIQKAHSGPINTLLVVDENLLATGDDGGTLKVWDLRKGSAFIDLKQHEDYISSIAVDQAKRTLLTASGDGTMGVFNLKRRRFELLSEFQSGDLTSVAVMKRGRKVVCGSSEGTIYIFNWNGFGATSDRFAVKAESIDCIVPVTDSIMCTASMDGYIRAINVMPNRVIGCLGQHIGEPIEQIAKSRDVHFLASCGHDQLIKFWDISKLPAMTVNDYRKRKKKDGRLAPLSKKALGGNDFYSGLVEEPEKKEEEDGQEEEEEDDESDSDSD